MIFDITTSDLAYKWLQETLDISGKNVIKDYIIKCNNDLDCFIDRHLNTIKAIDMNSIEFVVFHVTSNSNQCIEIKQHGIKNLQKVLAETSQLNLFLDNLGFKFDIQNKKMIYKGKIYNIDYESYKNKKETLTFQEEKLKDIARKIYFDHQVNGFFFSKDIFKYGTEIDKRPEFLLTLSAFNSSLDYLGNSWSEIGKGYVVKYKAKLSQFEYYTFYNDIHDYLNDSQTEWMQLKKWMFSYAIDCNFSNLYSDIYAYMKPVMDILPEQIIECIPVEEWR
ncbi:hypothetical protein LN736_13980 [Clostridium sp. WLY-B-L2]|uniref:Uncharacterized protein n=1 Tax=Clostridium aromativorans TaxID=2836848 RepID=A0ABS8NA88_9CLOT|nr:hypothetical protein [Clostridium aromativorans]MCC9295970.1 hypothetical protein [Clostridium aromativorans]